MIEKEEDAVIAPVVVVTPVPSEGGEIKEIQLTSLATDEGSDKGSATTGTLVDSDGEELRVKDVVENGAVDLHGNPAIKSKSGNWSACWLIFGCEVCERVAFYAISSNLLKYLTSELHEDIAQSAKNVMNWAGTTFLTPLLGAFVADAFLGRYWTLTAFCCSYVLAMVCVTLAVSVPSLKPPNCLSTPSGRVCPKASGLQVGFFYFALYLMAFGAGGIKSNVSAFAGDQFDENDPVESKRKLSFLNWWFVSISFGTMLSVSILVYVQDNVGWAWGYGAATSVTCIATTLFLLGSAKYRHQLPAGSPLTRIAQVLVAATRKWKLQVPDLELLYELEDPEGPHSPRHRKLPHSSGFVFLDKAAISKEEIALYKSRGREPNPWRLCPVTQVEEVKLLIRTLPIWMTNLMFSAVFAQVGTMFLSQGRTLDRRMGPHFMIPAASFPLFITLTICILLPLYDTYFVPFVRKLTGEERGLTSLQRIGIGQVISTIAIASAALVEMRRLRVARQHGLLDEPHTPLPMTIFWLLPQYMLIGTCEVFISVGMLEFFYNQAPDSMRSVGAALYLSTVAVGSFISSLLLSVVVKVTSRGSGGSWIGNNLNRAHLHRFYLLLTCLSTANFFLFLTCARWYQYKAVYREEDQERESSGLDDRLGGSMMTISETEFQHRLQHQCCAAVSVSVPVSAAGSKEGTPRKNTGSSSTRGARAMSFTCPPRPRAMESSFLSISC
ncbi:protein NRT1/ PTR FAMILY 8.1 [Selaginella moellendorffii]|uniref:protein NRT1/ PTR FAMILY 8.1 n=1 Tax=Selaginella moellendorffii TaxID=88036 RepID=UPI000D1CBBC7|nr:protein NRT1/ PTR FAMILY 8.1 [Selaginella moellendorffii]|eukprot:XP_024541256.1 protein NRT1/ PTR FAMILY 8.1 [Selaginella moellendorffii]